MQSARKLLFPFLIFLLMVSWVQAATTICLEWEVPQGKEVPDFDITLVLGRERVLFPPNNTTLKIGNSVAAIHDKTSPTDQECITLVAPQALSNYMVGIHHYSKDASDLNFLELYELRKNGTAKVIGEYREHFENNIEGEASATPRANSDHWVLLKVTDVMAALEPAPAAVAKSEPKQETASAAAPAAKVEQKKEEVEEPKAAEPDCEPGEDKDLRHCDFADKDLARSNFKGADISGVSFKKAKLKNAMFNEAKCYKTDFSHSHLEDASFVRAKCAQADFTKSDLREVNFKDADLTKANFRSADIRKVNFKRAHLRGSNYKEARRDDGANYEDIRE
ncbi:MAG: pentapeptide repeat-containing protein [SAR324 cluster bacterium]|nr:pentapeptide repeat-containing protein [SAR324 cluster bacterium]